MPAPTITHGYISAGFSGTDNVEVAFTSAVSSGHTVISGLSQQGSIRRGITAWTDTQAQSYSAIGSGQSQSGCHTEGIRRKENTAALSIGNTVSVTLDGTSEGRLHVLVISASTYASLEDSQNNSNSGATSHQCAATGFTTDGNVFVVGISTLIGTGGSITPSDGYTQQGSSLEMLCFTKASDSALGSTQVCPYTTENPRADTGVLAAFYASGGGGATPAGPMFARRRR